MKKIIAILSLVLGISSAFSFKDAQSVEERYNPTQSQNAIYSYANSIENAVKAVVNISTEKKVASAFPNHPMFDDPFFQQFFGEMYGRLPKERVDRSLGSGVVVSEQGHIITNQHVIEGADKILVSFAGSSKEYQAKLLGADAKSDLAVIKIEAKNTPFISFADSEKVRVGDVVFAIGNPFGVGETVTQGIVSALNKSNIGINDYEDFIQTDASINPGNSGGALVDSRGALIGINTAILSRTGGNHGVGFAIPSSMVKRVASELIQNGSVARGYLGVGIQDINNENLKEHYGRTDGSLIVSLEPNSPAQKAGLQVWDLIIEVNGKKISNSQDLRNTIGMMAPNSRVDVKFIRDKKQYAAQITLAKLADETAQTQAPTQGSEASANTSISGLSVGDLTQSNRQKFGISSDISGVVVTSVKSGSAAQQAGFEVGDVIARVENVEIVRVGDFNKALNSLKGKTKRILIYTRNGVKTIILK